MIAIDWGTTNRRIYSLASDGSVLASERDGLGILSVPAGGFEAEMSSVRARHGEGQMLLAGMVGSNRGWADAGYVDCPATLDTIAAARIGVAPGVSILPGVRTIADGRADVMRGEEVILLGAVAAGLAPADGLFCQPGTHAKWARVEGGAVTGFVTAMTGEMFAILKNHALIGSAMAGTVADDAAFAEGVKESARGDLLALLFGVRPASILGLRDDADAASYVSGLLIGSDCRPRVTAGAEIQIVCEGALAELYGRAIQLLGGKANHVDAEAAFLAGITRIRELTQ